MSGRTALITGGTSGIGKATARTLHDRGYRVAITGQRQESVARAREELPDDVLVLQSDARSLSDVDKVVSDVRARFGTVTTLFLNAGVNRPMTLENWDEAGYDEGCSPSTQGAYSSPWPRLSRFCPMASRSSSSWGSAQHAVSPTAASPRDLTLSMIPTLALELAPRRIRINAVSPGMTDTPMTRASIRTATDDVAGTMTVLAARNPFGRLATPEDIAGTVAFLASDDAAYITGQEIVVSGGAGFGHLTDVPRARRQDAAMAVIHKPLRGSGT